LPENLPQSPRSAGSAWAHEKRFADVLGRQMAYIERGVGHPIVFLHGNPTSSFLWRGVLPHVEAPGRRLIAPDLIGMGDSDKIPAGAEPDRYRLAGHARYLGAFLGEVAGTEPLTLVLHDWGPWASTGRIAIRSASARLPTWRRSSRRLPWRICRKVSVRR
jgi:haloalkane dehalogenase